MSDNYPVHCCGHDLRVDARRYAVEMIEQIPVCRCRGLRRWRGVSRGQACRHSICVRGLASTALPRRAHSSAGGSQRRPKHWPVVDSAGIPAISGSAVQPPNQASRASAAIIEGIANPTID